MRHCDWFKFCNGIRLIAQQKMSLKIFSEMKIILIIIIVKSRGARKRNKNQTSSSFVGTLGGSTLFWGELNDACAVLWLMGPRVSVVWTTSVEIRKVIVSRYLQTTLPYTFSMGALAGGRKTKPAFFLRPLEY